MLRDLRSSFEARLTESADAVVVALDRQIETRRVALNALSRAVKLAPLAALMAPDVRTRQRLAVLHTTAQYVAESLGDPVALFLPDGTVLFRSDVPFGD